MDRLTTGLVRVTRAGLVAGSLLVAGASAHAQDVLIGETTATFEWGQASGDVEFYDVYVSRSSRSGRDSSVPSSFPITRRRRNSRRSNVWAAAR